MMRSRIRGWLISILITWALLEIGAAVFIHTDQIPASPPSFTVPRPETPFFIDINPHFGAWHPPNQTRDHRRACFSTTYRSNSYGAIDVERSIDADEKRTIVLGDSFATGHGVIEEARFSNQLEHLTGIPHLNFAAGGTGPTQYLMVYTHLARKFAHDRVLVSILPDNDFFDDAPSTTRYRPYWDGEHPNYVLRYSLPSPSDSMHHPSRHRTALTSHRVLSSYSYLYNVVDWVLGYRKVMRGRNRQRSYAGYFDFTEEQFLRLRHSMEQLHARSPGGRLAVMGIPRYADLIRYRETQTNPFGDRMKATADEVGFTFVDVLPRFAEDYSGRERELFLSCDGHWSVVGHRAAAEILSDRLYANEKE